MFKLGIIGLFLIIGFMIIPVNFVSAQMGDSFVSTDRTHYQAGDIIDITGFFPTGNLAYFKILNPNGLSATGGWESTSMNPYDNTFDISFDTAGSGWSQTGIYVVKIMSHGQDLFEQTTFHFKISDEDQAELDAKEKDKQERIVQLEAKEKDEQKEKIAQLEADQEAQQAKIAQLEAEQQQAKIAQLEADQNGGGCLIATATYGSEMALEVQQLRELRDNTLLNTESGTQFMQYFNDVYYSFSPIIADYERENPYFKEAVKLAITPMISTLSLMENAETESEVLSIGISVIVLNLAMYLGVPAVVIVGIRKRF